VGCSLFAKGFLHRVVVSLLSALLHLVVVSLLSALLHLVVVSLLKEVSGGL